jgi:hypothetical protein
VKFKPEPKSAKRHKFDIPDTMNGEPIKRCANAGCQVIWRHGKMRPQNNCEGK